MKYIFILIISIAVNGFSQEKLTNLDLEVSLDRSFPRVVNYRLGNSEFIEGDTNAINRIKVNNKEEPFVVHFKKNSDSTAVYTIYFSQLDNRIELSFELKTNYLQITSKLIRETHKIYTVAFLNNALLTFSDSNTKIATVKSTTMHDNHKGVFKEYIGTLSEIELINDEEGNYLFLNNKQVATGIYNNHYTDIKRTKFSITKKDSLKQLEAWFPELPFRKIESELAAIPVTKVFLCKDLNNSNTITWQDAAIEYRNHVPHPYKSETIKKLVGENIAMNFASGAQQPFLKILDEVKKIHRATDGLENQIIIKGFSAEGHDSANTDYSGHYNSRAGGSKDLNFLVDNAHKFNTQIGVHINVSEVYPEAHRFDPDIIQRHEYGDYIKGWEWLDQSYRIDKFKDIVKGGIRNSLTQMKQEIPNLDFVYVDTYHSNGWPAWKLSELLKELDLAFYTEGSISLDPWVIWAHWRSSKNTSEVMRFIWFSQRDLFAADPLLKMGRSDVSGFMGWQNQHDFNSYIAKTFENGLPFKYLQHFQLLEKTTTSAVFSEGIKVTLKGDSVTVTKNGNAFMSWDKNNKNHNLFIPWSPVNPEKIYVWNNNSDQGKHKLPSSWNALKYVYQYKLSDAGKTEQTKLKVENGVVLIKVNANTPYVIYKTARGNIDYNWSEGSFINNTGFDNTSIAPWKTNHKKGIHISTDKNRNTFIRVKNKLKTTKLDQSINNLKPNSHYIASVWVKIDKKANVSLSVKTSEEKFTKSISKTAVKNGQPNHPYKNTFFQRIELPFYILQNTEASVQISIGKQDAEVWLDDVRIVTSKKNKKLAEHYFYEDFENLPLGGYGPFASVFDEHIHLSENNPPYTHDVISGDFALKSRAIGKNITRTLPSRLLLTARTKFNFVADVLLTENTEVNLKVMNSKNEVIKSVLLKKDNKKVNFNFETDATEDCYIAIDQKGKGVFVIDNLIIDIR